MIGETILHYKILEKLGGGGMGVVYKAEDTKLDRTVALKFLPPHLLADKESEQRFISEAKAASSFDHPNICTIHDIEKTDDDQLFIVMAYYQGETLKKKIETGPIKIDEAIDIVGQIAEGLKRAHNKGIVHRDIKPANIFITNEGIAKILDFGLAKVSKRQKLTTMGTTMGTIAYMSPEQTKGEEVDHRTDIWSLGIVLYEMLTGRPPFKGDYEQATMYSIMNDQPEPITGLRTGVPMKLEYLVEKALSKNQDERYQHVDDILADLRRERKNIEYEKVDLASMRSSTSYVKTGQPKKNYRRYYIYGSIIIILAVIATYLMFFRQGPEINSIAVLPISITSSESSTDILSDGIAEGIINSLSLIPSLKVMSWNSVFQYAGENVDVQEVGISLDVKAVLLGRITQRGDSYSISFELVDADNKQHIWGAHYSRHASDIYSLQGEVSKDISDQLRVKLTREEEKRVTRNYTENSEAYTLYLKGRFYMRKRTEEGLRKSIDFFNKAIEKDPNYALAYVGISDGYSLLAANSYIPAEDGYPKAKQAIRKALDLDNELAEAHASLAAILGDSR